MTITKAVIVMTRQEYLGKQPKHPVMLWHQSTLHFTVFIITIFIFKN